MAKFKHGSMDTADQEKTFHGFVKFATNFVIAAVIFFIFLALVNG